MKRTRIGAAVIGLALAGGALAGLPPGYTWGLGNCGPAVNDSRAKCQNCCRRSATNGTINAAELQGCLQACRDSAFPPRSWFHRLVLIVFD